MIISAASDYRAAAQRILPPFLFHYMDGGAYSEYTLRRNVEDLSEVALRQRILKNMSDLSLETTLFNEKLSMPVALAPVGLCGMYARRGEVQAAKAADAHGIPFTLSTVSVCPIEEVAPAIKRPMWFQLYVLRDRGFMRNALERAKAAGCSTLVFTVDMPTPGARYRDAHSGMSGPNAAMRRYLQAVTHPQWAWDVGLNGRPLADGLAHTGQHTVGIAIIGSANRRYVNGGQAVEEGKLQHHHTLGRIGQMHRVLAVVEVDGGGAQQA